MASCEALPDNKAISSSGRIRGRRPNRPNREEAWEHTSDRGEGSSDGQMGQGRLGNSGNVIRNPPENRVIPATFPTFPTSQT